MRTSGLDCLLRAPLAQATAVAGGQAGVPLLGGRLEMPTECLELVLRHSSTKSLLISLCRVTKGWLAACRDASLYTTLDCVPLSVPMTGLLALLKQPKFGRVEQLVFHHKMKLGTTGAKQLAVLAPNLWHVDRARAPRARASRIRVAHVLARARATNVHDESRREIVPAQDGHRARLCCARRCCRSLP
jgi:hypothetical protein